MAQQHMSAEQLLAILTHLELDIPNAAIAFGVTDDQVLAMVTGAQPVPFLVSGMAVLMCESEITRWLALQHGEAWRQDDPKLDEVIAEAAGAQISEMKLAGS